MSVIRSVKNAVVRADAVLQTALSAAGFAQPQDVLAADAQDYWTTPREKNWASNSHWRSSLPDRLWWRLGDDHRQRFLRGADAAGFARELDRVVDWGCGGGANAVAFAPYCGELVGVDVSDDTLAECAAQVAAVCDTPFRAVRIDVARPEAARDVLGEVDAFVCYYVFELIPDQSYGVRLLRIAYDVLAKGGLAHVQIEYSNGRFAQRSKRRAYRRHLASMTTYEPARFRELAEACGFRCVLEERVPRNELDERYAYFTLVKP